MTRILGFLLVLLTSAPALAQHSAGRWPFPLVGQDFCADINVDLPRNGSAAQHEQWCIQRGGMWRDRICSTPQFTYEFAYYGRSYRSMRYVKVRPNWQVSDAAAADWVRTISQTTERRPANEIDDNGFGVRVLHWNVASPNAEPWVVALFYSERDSRLTLMVMTWMEWNIEEWD